MASLHDKAQAVARGLIARDVVAGRPRRLDAADQHRFLRCLLRHPYAGAMPVPIYPPMRLSQIEEHLRRQVGILRNAGACLLITMPEGRRLAGLLRAQVEALNTVESVARSSRSRDGADRTAAAGECRARSRSSNTRPAAPAIRKASCSATPICSPISAPWAASMDASSADVFVSWLPLYHDMGLIGAWLGCLYFARAALRHVAVELPGAAGKLAVGDAPVSRDFLRGAQFRFRAVHQQDRRRRYRGT